VTGPALLVRCALTGAASGGRTFTGLAALTLSAPPGATRRPDTALSTTPAKALIGAAAVGELIADKLPRTPSRLETGALLGRLAAGAGSAVILARRWPPDPTPAAADTAVGIVVGAAAAAATSWLGSRWRSFGDPRLPGRVTAALLEDAATIALAVAAAR
jgi:uncharacterized membrane protein